MIRSQKSYEPHTAVRIVKTRIKNVNPINKTSSYAAVTGYLDP